MERNSITLSIKEIADLVDFAGLELKQQPSEDELETEITICDCPKDGIENDDGKSEHFDYIAYLTDYPEEGCYPLGEPK